MGHGYVFPRNALDECNNKDWKMYEIHVKLLAFIVQNKFA